MDLEPEIRVPERVYSGCFLASFWDPLSHEMMAIWPKSGQKVVQKVVDFGVLGGVPGPDLASSEGAKCGHPGAKRRQLAKPCTVSPPESFKGKVRF